MVFVLFGWGTVAYNKQALLAARSILARSDSAKILIFASHPELFLDERIDVVPITKFDLANWKGPLGFIHRPKIHILKKSLLKIDDHEPLCYIDSDMYCYDVPEEFNVHRNGVLMFNNEGRVGTGFHPKLHKFLLTNRELLTKNNYSDLFADVEMYNSGLIYLPPSSWRMKALEQVLDLTDLLCVHFPQQMTWVEQASFSYVLPKFSKIGTISNGFEHYWGYNLEIGHLLGKMTIKQIEDIAKSRQLFDELSGEAKFLQKTITNKLSLFLYKQKKSISKQAVLLKAKYYLSR